MGGCKPSAAIPIPRLPKPRVGLRKPARQQGWHCAEAILSYLELHFYIKKNQNFKNMWPFQEIAKMGPCSPGRRRLAFLVKKITNKSLGSAARGLGGRGAGRPPQGATGSPSLYKASTPIPSSFEPKNSTKNSEKKERGEEKGSGKALPDCALVICR